MFLRLSASWKLIKKLNREKSLEDYEELFYIWILKQYTWRLLDLPEKIKHCLFILYLCSIILIYVCNLFIADLLPKQNQPKHWLIIFSKLSFSSHLVFFCWIFFIIAEIQNSTMWVFSQYRASLTRVGYRSHLNQYPTVTFFSTLPSV